MRASASDPTLSLIERSAETTEAVRTFSSARCGLRDPAARDPRLPERRYSCAHQRNDVCRRSLLKL